MNKRISYVTLGSDIYVLVFFSCIIYGIFFNFERIGLASFTITNINEITATIIAIIEIIFCLIMAYLLHKCNYKSVRILLIILCVLNIIYRIFNTICMINPFTLLMLLINTILFLILLFYPQADNK